MKSFISFIYAILMVFALCAVACFRIWEGEWFTGLLMLFVLFWNIMIYLRKWGYPYLKE